jgi:ubiquinone/menaquinone biosynthesis C-methylase UbiE
MSDKRTIVREFDAKAAVYETNRLAAWYKGHAERIVERLALQPGALVLDVGCGTGYLLRAIVRRFPGVDGVGLDLAPAMIEQARNKAASEGIAGLRFECADWEDGNLSGDRLFADRRPSCILCVNALHYCSAPQAAFDKMWRMLAPGGKAWVLERAREGSALTAVWAYLHHYLIRDHVRFYKTGDLLDMMRRSGFEQARTEISLRKILWRGKAYTSVALISGVRI